MHREESCAPVDTGCPCNEEWEHKCESAGSVALLLGAVRSIDFFPAAWAQLETVEMVVKLHLVWLLDTSSLFYVLKLVGINRIIGHAETANHPPVVLCIEHGIFAANVLVFLQSLQAIPGVKARSTVAQWTAAVPPNVTGQKASKRRSNSKESSTKVELSISLNWPSCTVFSGFL